MPPGRPGPRTAAHHPPSAQRGGPPQAPADVPGGPGGSRPRTPNAPQSARGAPLASQGRHAPEATALAAAAARTLQRRAATRPIPGEQAAQASGEGVVVARSIRSCVSRGQCSQQVIAPRPRAVEEHQPRRLPVRHTGWPSTPRS